MRGATEPAWPSTTPNSLGGIPNGSTASPRLDLIVPVRSAGPEGGAERSVFEVTQELSSRGHRVHLLYRRAGAFLDGYGTFCASTTQIPALGGARFEPFTSAVAALLAPSWTRKVPATAVAYLNAMTDLPFTMARTGPSVLHLREPPPRRRSAAWSRLMRQTTHFIAVSQMIADSYARRFPTISDRIKVVHNGVSPSRYQPPTGQQRASARALLGISGSEAVAVYAGRLTPAKGVETLLRAAQQLLPGRLRVVVAGGPDSFRAARASRPYVSGLRSLAPPGTEFVGVVKDNRSLFAAADFVVVPSLWDEPFSRVVVEAMTCGLPVLASLTGGTPEAYTGFEQWLFPPNSHVQLASLMEQLIDMGGHGRRRLGMAFRDHALTGFSLNRTVDGIEEVLIAANEVG